MKVYSLHKIIDGKWEITLKVKESNDFEKALAARPDIKAIVDANYNLEIPEMAKMLLDNVMDCVSVEISMLWGPTVIMEKQQ